MSEYVDLSEHEFRSMRGWLNGLFPGVSIYIHRPDTGFSRPALVLSESVPRRFEDHGRGFGVMSHASWQIEVLGTDFFSTKRDTAKISERLLTGLLVPCYLYGWRYPAPDVLEVPGEGSLAAGQLSVVVTAVNAQEEETLGTGSVVTVSAGSAADVVIAPWPRQATVAEVYRVYAGAAGSEVFQVEVSPQDEPSPLTHRLLSVAGAGAAVPTSSVFFHRFMRVDGAQSQILEHPDTDGIFNGIVSVQTSLLSQRLMPMAPSVAEIVVEQEYV